MKRCWFSTNSETDESSFPDATLTEPYRTCPCIRDSRYSPRHSLPLPVPLSYSGPHALFELLMIDASVLSDERENPTSFQGRCCRRYTSVTRALDSTGVMTASNASMSGVCVPAGGCSPTAGWRILMSPSTCTYSMRVRGTNGWSTRRATDISGRFEAVHDA